MKEGLHSEAGRRSLAALLGRRLWEILMKLELIWKEKMQFSSHTANHEVLMDAKAPIGSSSAQTPKELLASALAGCTAMDVIALMRKHKQEVESFKIAVDISAQEKGHPAVFTAAKLDYYLQGQVDPAIALQAVQLSQSQYCGVSAMLAKAFPISWTLWVNGSEAGNGQANFP